MTKQFYEKMESGYYHKVFTSSNPVQRYWHSGRFAKILGKLNLNENTKILDLGCGPGTLLSLIKGKYALAVGIDFDKKQIDFAKSNFNNKNITWLCGDVTKLDIKDKFDYIICSEVIEHVPPKEADKLLHTIRGLLKSSGTAILTTPNYGSLWPIIEWFVNKLGDVDYSEQHVNKLDIRKFEYSLRRNKFEINHVETFYIISPFLSFISFKFARFIQVFEEKLLPKFGSVILIEATK